MTHAEILNKVKWKDLRKLTLREMLIENNLTLPWLTGSMILAWFGHYILAMPFSAFFFLTALRYSVYPDPYREFSIVISP